MDIRSLTQDIRQGGELPGLEWNAAKHFWNGILIKNQKCRTKVCHELFRPSLSNWFLQQPYCLLRAGRRGLNKRQRSSMPNWSSAKIGPLDLWGSFAKMLTCWETLKHLFTQLLLQVSHQLQKACLPLQPKQNIHAKSYRITSLSRFQRVPFIWISCKETKDWTQSWQWLTILTSFSSKPTKPNFQSKIKLVGRMGLSFVEFGVCSYWY